MDTHALARESLSQPKRPATPRLQEPQRPSPQVTLSPFRQRPATEPDDETAQQLARKSSFALDHLTDAELLGSTRSMVGRSNVVFAALLAHLAEVEARRVFRERACSSLYAYCVYELRMSEDAAQRRVQAARLVRKFPELLEVVAAGELHLTGLLLLGPHLTHENLAQLLPLAKHRSKREILALVRRLDPKPNALARIEPLGPAIVNAACGGTWEQWIGSFTPVNHLQPGDRPRDWIPCDAGATVEVPGAGGRTDDRSTPGDGGNADAGARVHGGEDAGVVSGTLLPVGAQVLGREDPRGVSGTMLPAGAQVHGEENAGVVSGTMLPVGAQVHGDTDPGVVSEDLLPASTQVHSEDPRGVSGTMLPAGTRPAQGSLTAPQRYTVQFTASEEHVQLLQEARDLLGPALKGRAIEEVHLRAMRALVRELKKRKFAMVEGPRAA
nr:hypothetical protein [Polyangiaceae bacterium]